MVANKQFSTSHLYYARTFSPRSPTKRTAGKRRAPNIVLRGFPPYRQSADTRQQQEETEKAPQKVVQTWSKTFKNQNMNKRNCYSSS